MLEKIISVIIALITLLTSLFSAPDIAPKESESYIEERPVEDVMKNIEKFDGAPGVEFYIESPADAQLKAVNAADFGLSENAADNFEALQQAFDFCAANPGTKLVINKGTYNFNTDKPLVLDSCENILVDGSGARFVFSYTGTKINLTGCDCVEFKNLNTDWAHGKDPIASAVKITSADKKAHSLELEFILGNADENLNLAAMTQCDPETLTFGAKGGTKECYLYQIDGAVQSVEKINENTLRVTHNGCMDNFSAGETYILRHHVYDGTVFGINGYSKNLTFDGVNIYGSTGMAFVVNGNASHFIIKNCYIGVEPGCEKERCVSLGADAIHIVNSDGCFVLEGCDISGMGDDALNVHDGLGYIESASGSRMSVIASAMRLQPGDVLKFKNPEFFDINYSAKIVSVKLLGGIKSEIEIEGTLPPAIGEGYIIYNTACSSANYIIRDNYFHENRARGLLLQSPNGLCENNRFYKIEGQAIKIVMDIMPTLWQEGTGVDNLVIKNNTFTLCNYSCWGEIITIGGNIDGGTVKAQAFTNITIEGNTFEDISSRILKADNVNGLEYSGNTVIKGSTFPASVNKGRIETGKYCANLNIEK